MVMIIYEGNCSTSVNKDGKYSIRSDAGKYVVGMEYRTSDDERWYPTSNAHEGLVKMVNQVKNKKNGAPGGSFFINEYRQVIVPAGDPVVYYLAGEYTEDQVFVFNDHLISGSPHNFNGVRLDPGDDWEGPHQGFRYKLKAGANDISYMKTIRPNVQEEVKLSRIVGGEQARQLARRIGEIMGQGGGRFYINEFRVFFTGSPYKYIGDLKTEDPWFPKPHAANTADE